MGNLILRIPDEIHQAASKAALDADRSLNTWILRAIQEKLDVAHPSKRPGRRPVRKAVP